MLLLFLDFDKIREEAAKPKNQLGKANVLIERAPVCKSIFVSEIPENTSQEEIEKYFVKFGVVEKFVTNIEEVKAGRTKEGRAIVYFKNEKSMYIHPCIEQFMCRWCYAEVVSVQTDISVHYDVTGSWTLCRRTSHERVL